MVFESSSHIYYGSIIKRKKKKNAKKRKRKVKKEKEKRKMYPVTKPENKIYFNLSEHILNCFINLCLTMIQKHNLTYNLMQ